MGYQSSMIRPSAKSIKSRPHLCAETQYAEHLPVMQSFTGTSLVGGTDGTVSSDILYMTGGGRYPDLFNDGDGSQLGHPYFRRLRGERRWWGLQQSEFRTTT